MTESAAPQRIPMLADMAAGPSPIIPDLPIFRTRQEGEQRATFFELFFDLVYVFAVTQVSHHLLDDLGREGLAMCYPASHLSSLVTRQARQRHQAEVRAPRPGG